MKLLFIFLDGVGLGIDDARINPFARADMPYLQRLLGGKRLLVSSAPYHGERASLVSLDAGLGIEGLPQSATGQAVLLTGKNVAELIGYHYGPKPNLAVAEFVRDGNVFSLLNQKDYRAALLNAYPPRYFESIGSGRRLYSAIPMAVTSAGIPLKTEKDLYEGKALSADFTGQGWRDHLGYSDTPVMDHLQAGERLAALAQDYELAFFEFWLSDYAGHKQNMEAACTLLEGFDRVLGGLSKTWKDEDGLVLITSDHGNLEDLSTRRHTNNPVPALLLGAEHRRQEFTAQLSSILDIAPTIMEFITQDTRG